MREIWLGILKGPETGTRTEAFPLVVGHGTVKPRSTRIGH